MIYRLDHATRVLQAVVREVFRPRPDVPEDNWTPQGTCDSVCETLDEDGLIYEAFPGAELAMWEGGHPWESGHCFFRLPDGTIVDPTVWQFTKEDRDWFGAVYRVADDQVSRYYSDRKLDEGKREIAVVSEKIPTTGGRGKVEADSPSKRDARYRATRPDETASRAARSPRDKASATAVARFPSRKAMNQDGTVTQIRGARVTCSCGSALGPFPMGRSVNALTEKALKDHRALHGGLRREAEWRRR